MPESPQETHKDPGFAAAVSESLTIIAPQGDVKIVVDDEMKPGSYRAFQVSSVALSLACKPWEAMLAFDTVAREQDTDGHRIFRLGDDNGDALEVLLNIAHLRFSEVPNRLVIDLLAAVAVLTDKYQATALIKPWASNWYAWCAPEAQGNNIALERATWIQWEFGLQPQFESNVASMVQNVELDENKQLVMNGLMLDTMWLAPGLETHIRTLRNATIGKILDFIYALMDSLMQEDRHCAHGKGSKDNTTCKALSHWCLAIGLRKVGLWPQASTDSILTSIAEIDMAIKGIRIEEWARGRHIRY